MTVTADAPFGTRTTYRVGGTAARLVEVVGPEELEEAISATGQGPVYVLGRGSNTLVSDAGFAGTVLHLGEGFSTIAVDRDSFEVTAGASADLPVVARRTVEEGLTGFEWAVGVPGTVGGGVRMNAGGHGSDMASSVISAEVLDLRTGERRTWSLDELGFSYRHSTIEAHHLVLSARFRLAEGDPEAGRAELREIVRWRREHQPGGANCGSVFTNPPDDSAGRLIEAAGLKGKRLGTAHVSLKHANFIQADQGGHAEDVANLIDEVAAAVEGALGVHLVAEVRRVGFSGWHT